MEIVTWVLDGTLEHRDSEGNDGVITRDVAQRMSAGTRHPPLRDRTRATPNRYTCCRCGCRPTRRGIAPGYEQRDVGGEIKPDELFPLASGRETDAAITHPPARRHAVDRAPHRRLDASRSPTRPSSTCSSRAARDARRRGPPDRATPSRLTDAGALDATAAGDDTELVIWETWSDLT